MSILLDALKKSEEQRQLGTTPSIHSPGSAAAGSRGAGRQWIPLVLVAAGAIALAWIGWQQYRTPPDQQGDAAPARVEAAQEARDPGGRADQTATASPEAAGQRTETGHDSAAEEPAQTVVAPRPGVSLRTPVEGFRPESRSLQDVTILPPADFQAKPPAPPPAPAAAAAAAAQPQPRPSRAEPHIPEPISFWELPQGVRDGLPELRITVLVFAERPQDRFLLLNGQRMVEKDTLEGGVLLDEIRRDGAVFQYRTYRFLVKD